MATKLYGSRLSPFVEKVASALEIKGVEFEIVPPKSPGDLKKWNPTTRKMPVLEIGTEKIYDSTFILRRLDELHPEPALLSSDPRTAAAQRLLEDWADESLYWYVMALRWTGENTPRTLNQILGNLPAIVRPLARIMIKRQVGTVPAAQGLGRLPVDVLVRELAGRLDDLIDLLGDGPFFYSESVSVADLAVFGMLNTLDSEATPEGQKMLAERATLQVFLDRVRSAARSEEPEEALAS